MEGFLLKEGYERVTNVLYPFSGYGAIDPIILQRAADRGTKAHTAIESYLSGTGLWDADEQSLLYLESAKKFWGEGYYITCMEKRFYDERLLITGQCDLIIKTESGNVLLDWKTSSKENKTWKMQGAAYANMAMEDGFHIDEVWFVKLDKLGKQPEIFRYKEILKDYALFLKCYEIYNEFFKNCKKLDGLDVL